MIATMPVNQPCRASVNIYDTEITVYLTKTQQMAKTMYITYGTSEGRVMIDTLTHWGRVTHICVIELTIIGSDNGLSPDRRQAIIWTNAGLLLFGPLGTNFSEILIEILTFSFKKMRLKVSSVKRWPFCLGINVLTVWGYFTRERVPASATLSNATRATPAVMTAFIAFSARQTMVEVHQCARHFPRDPFYWYEITSILAWINNYIHYIMRHEITSPTSTIQSLWFENGKVISLYNYQASDYLSMLGSKLSCFFSFRRWYHDPYFQWKPNK